ncbi:hypothetical protein Pint_18124 [Pistacia integerrima]|uniref:Uncharacterized protein n=1 Tax=Pistacia integerrima TaxID=434235 RepID=A0ACC0YU52_9ROSI|nr:hypothetical protein Pint_18124 [Pistacia integerrima]
MSIRKFLVIHGKIVQADNSQPWPYLNEALTSNISKRAFECFCR